LKKPKTLRSIRNFLIIKKKLTFKNILAKIETIIGKLKIITDASEIGKYFMQ
jgi:hypothetical protein